MGAVGGVPRSGMQTTAWGIEILDWNAKWVLGYPGTNDLFVALERGEIDMTASSNLFQVVKLLETGKVKVLTQTGLLENGKFTGRSEFGDVPVFPNQVQGKVKDPVQEQGYSLLVRSRAARQMAGAAARHAEADRRRPIGKPSPRWPRILNSSRRARR